MNMAAVEETIIMMCPNDTEVISNVKHMFAIINADPQKGCVSILGSVPALGLEKPSWLYGVMCGIALSAASGSPDMVKNFKR